MNIRYIHFVLWGDWAYGFAIWFCLGWIVRSWQKKKRTTSNSIFYTKKTVAFFGYPKRKTFPNKKKQLFLQLQPMLVTKFYLDMYWCQRRLRRSSILHFFIIEIMTLMSQTTRLCSCLSTTASGLESYINTYRPFSIHSPYIFILHIYR